MVILNEFSSIKEWGNLFLYKKQGEVSLGHFKSLQSNINHINIFFGNRAISSIRALEIDDFLKSPRLVLSLIHIFRPQVLIAAVLPMFLPPLRTVLLWEV